MRTAPIVVKHFEHISHLIEPRSDLVGESNLADALDRLVGPATDDVGEGTVGIASVAETSVTGAAGVSTWAAAAAAAGAEEASGSDATVTVVELGNEFKCSENMW